MKMIAIAAALSAGAPAPSLPTREEVQTIESSVILPDEAPLDHYVRYYTVEWNDVGQRRIIAGYVGIDFFHGLRDRVRPIQIFSPLVVIVAGLPTETIDDGGCDVIHLSYTPATHKFEVPICNYEA